MSVTVRYMTGVEDFESRWSRIWPLIDAVQQHPGSIGASVPTCCGSVTRCEGERPVIASFCYVDDLNAGRAEGPG